MRISSTQAIEGSRILYTIGEIQAASAWHPENMAPLQQEWREQILRELIRKYGLEGVAASIEPESDHDALWERAGRVARR